MAGAANFASLPGFNVSVTFDNPQPGAADLPGNHLNVHRAAERDRARGSVE